MDLVERVISMAVAIQGIPAPTFSEMDRAEFILHRFREEGLLDVEIDDIGNVYGRFPGGGIKTPLVVSAHSDTVFQEDIDLSLTRKEDTITGPGIGDNSLGVAGLFGLLWYLRENGITLPGDLWLVSNVGEEGLGDLRGIKAVTDRFGEDVLAYIILEGMALGNIFHRGLGVQRYKITARTAGGHSWVNYGDLSAIHELAKLVEKLTALSLPESPRTTLNVGVIEGGTSVNTIAPRASLQLDLRSEAQEALQVLITQVEELVDQSEKPGAAFEMEIIGQRPAGDIRANHPLVRLAVKTLESLDLPAVLNIGSTDANVPLHRGLPAVCIGLTTGNGAHTVHERIDLQPLGKGLVQLGELVRGVFDVL